MGQLQILFVMVSLFSLRNLNDILSVQTLWTAESYSLNIRSKLIFQSLEEITAPIIVKSPFSVHIC